MSGGRPTSLRIVRALLVKEYLHILRDPRSLFAAFAIPIVLLTLFGYAIDFDVKRVTVAVWDQDRTAQSRDVLDHLLSTGTMVRVADVQGNDDVDRTLRRAEARVVLVIPPDFGRTMLRGETAEIQAVVDGTEGSFAALALGYVQGAIVLYGRNAATANLQGRGLDELTSRVPAIRLAPRTWFNETQESRQFTIPGLMAIIVMMLAAQLTSQCVAREFERGTIEPLIASPLAGWELVAGKLLPYVTIGVGQIALVSVLAVFWFGVPFRGSFPLFVVASAAFLVGAMGIGLLLSIVTRSQQLAQQLAVLLTMLPSLLLSGFIFPIASMPVVLRGVSYVFPARYFLSIVRGVMLRGADASALLPDLVFMIVFAVGITALCMALFRKVLR